ncbi:hypothetical protein M231_05434 [Tremella mesenterica]|uniref:Zn(2)-C6 fungal-type domain-containing protein n=1 Tax=Tremella mesenterica TaxID=5217 RepID=A0A4Q1BI46_TREME|nr:hypothetical protein M231_05434 [Tremella mesenterica]
MEHSSFSQQLQAGPSNTKNYNTFQFPIFPPLPTFSPSSSSSGPAFPTQSSAPGPSSSNSTAPQMSISEMPSHSTVPMGRFQRKSVPQLFPEGVLPTDGEDWWQGQKRKSAPSIFDEFVHPMVNLATGDRFTQLLEAKLNLDQAQTSSSSSSYNLLDNPHTLSQTQSALQSQTQLQNLTSTPMQDLALEAALQDFSQVHIPPDLVAPALPEDVWKWDPIQGVYSTVGFSNFYHTPATTHAPKAVFPFDFSMGTSSTSASIPLTQSQPQVPTQSQPQPQLEPQPVVQVPTQADPTQSDSISNQNNLPPVLKIRVHGQSQSSPPLPFPSALPSAQTRRSALSSRLSPLSAGTSACSAPPGSWALEMLKPSHSNEDYKIWQQQSHPLPSFQPVDPPSLPTALPTPPRRSSPDRKRKKAHMSLCMPASKNPDQKAVIACHMCRARKLKCDGARPKCHHCSRRNEDVCEYDAILRRRGPGKKNKNSHLGSEDKHRSPSQSDDNTIQDREGSRPSIDSAQVIPSFQVSAPTPQQVSIPLSGFMVGEVPEVGVSNQETRGEADDGRIGGMRT